MTIKEILLIQAWDIHIPRGWGGTYAQRHTHACNHTLPLYTRSHYCAGSKHKYLGPKYDGLSFSQYTVHRMMRVQLLHCMTPSHV